MVVARAKTNVGALVQLHAGKAVAGTTFRQQLRLERGVGAVGGPVVEHTQGNLVTRQILLEQTLKKGRQPFFRVVGDD